MKLSCRISNLHPWCMLLAAGYWAVDGVNAIRDTDTPAVLGLVMVPWLLLGAFRLLVHDQPPVIVDEQPVEVEGWWRRNLRAWRYWVFVVAFVVGALVLVNAASWGRATVSFFLAAVLMLWAAIDYLTRCRLVEAEAAQ